MSEAKRARTLGAVLYEDFELLDVYGPLEMFGSVGTELRIVTVAERAGPVRSFQGPRTVAEFDFATAPELDLILLPGGFGTMRELENPAMLDFLRRRSAAAEVTMSVCSGSALLAKAGLLDGRRATSNKMFFQVARSQSDRVEWVTAARWGSLSPSSSSSRVGPRRVVRGSSVAVRCSSPGRGKGVLISLPTLRGATPGRRCGSRPAERPAGGG